MLLVAALALFLQVGPPMPAPVPPPEVTVRSEITVQAPPPDPEATAEMAGWSFSGIVVMIVAPAVVEWANDILDVPDFIRSTPPDMTYQKDGVVAMAMQVRNVAIGLLGLAILGWAIGAMLRGEANDPGRIVLGVVLALGNLTFWEWGIRLNNGITGAISAPSLGDVARPHLRLPQVTSDPSEAFAPAMLVVAVGIVCLMLVGAMYMRLGLIDILIVAGSLALMCKSSEHSDRFADVYIGMATGTLFSQVTVVIALKLATVLGIEAGGITGAILTVVVLILAMKMPGLLGHRFAQSSGGIGRVGMLVLLRRALVRA